MADAVTTGLTLAWPWLLVLLPLPLLVRRWLKPAAGSGASALRVPWFAMLDDSGSAWMRKPMLATLAALAWLALLLAAARPQWVGEIQTLPVTGRDLLLAVDISGSMDTQDMVLGGKPVNRLAVVKKVAGEFIQGRRGDRVGLVLFAWLLSRQDLNALLAATRGIDPAAYGSALLLFAAVVVPKALRWRALAAATAGRR